ncbi:MAG: glycosyltransferase family 61 protein [bacterium]
MRPNSPSLRRAFKLLDRGRLDEALAEAGELSSGASARAAQSIARVCEALTCEAEGNSTRASELFEAVFTNEVPLPSVLKACARYFKRTGRYEQAFQAFALLETFDPRLGAEFLEDLPEPEVIRYAPWLARHCITAHRPKLYHLQPIKATLLRHLSTDVAAQLLARPLGHSADWRLRRLPVAGLLDVAREHGLSYHDVIPGRNVYLQPMKVLGREPAPGRTIVSRTVACAMLADVTVQNKSDVLISEDQAIFDWQGDEPGRATLDMNLSPSVIGQADRSRLFAIVSGESRTLPCALSLAGVHSYCFGDWLWQFLPKLFACLGRPEFAAVPIIVDDQMPPQHFEALAFFAGASHEIIRLKSAERIRVERLWVCSAVAYFPIGWRTDLPTRPDLFGWDPQALADLIGKVRDKLPEVSSSGGPRRIYLARRDTQRRRLVNRRDVEAWAEANGFALMYLEEHGFLDQLRLIRGADVVIGPEGSALFMCLFARPGQKIGILDHPFVDEFEPWLQTFEALGHSAWLLTGKPVGNVPEYKDHTNYTIEPGALDVLCRRLGVLDTAATGDA